jgi:hypothetical protein
LAQEERGYNGSVFKNIDLQMGKLPQPRPFLIKIPKGNIKVNISNTYYPSTNKQNFSL